MDTVCFSLQDNRRNFEKIISDISKQRRDFTVIIGKFYDKSTTWWYGDATTAEGTPMFYQLHT